YVEGLTSVEGGYGRTGSRSPMQWDDSVNAGFSSAPADKLYIPIDPSADRPTAKAQTGDEGSLRSEVKKLIGIRQGHPALQSLGEIEFVSDGAPGKPLAYIRTLGEEKILVVINPTGNDYAAECAEGEVIYSFGSYELKAGTLTVNARSAVFVKL
ncbi:MAG: glycosylase, partial [Lachnospiraceae bacterium]|nr:glycosylase [Lachnospiraceae bacterium]